MTCTDHKDIRAGPHAQTGRHAVGYGKAVDDYRHINGGTASVGEWVEGIDFIDASDCKVRGGVSVRQQKVTRVGIKNGTTEPSEGDSPNATGRSARSWRAEISANLSRSCGGE